MKKVMVIASHPDDEILGCGATMARLISEGAQVKVLIAAEGLTSRQTKRDTSELEKELKELRKISFEANKKLGVTDVEFLGLPDNRMDSLDLLDVIKVIEEKVSQFMPDTIFTHFPNDLNVDHKILSEAVLTSTRPMPGTKVKEIYFFEITSSTEWNFTGSAAKSFAPSVFFDVSNFIEKKVLALEVYKGEMREYPHARSIQNIRNQAGFRGGSVGFYAAEAFMLARKLV
jgi:LmbE family N-acetylglucosaminyl deacetylase